MINNNAQDRVTRLPLVHASGLSASPSPSKEKPSLLQALGPLSLLLPSLVSTFLLQTEACPVATPPRHVLAWAAWLAEACAPASTPCMPTYIPHAAPGSRLVDLSPDRAHPPVVPPRIRRTRSAPLRYALLVDCGVTHESRY